MSRSITGRRQDASTAEGGEEEEGKIQTGGGHGARLCLQLVRIVARAFTSAWRTLKRCCLLLGHIFFIHSEDHVAEATVAPRFSSIWLDNLRLGEAERGERHLSCCLTYFLIIVCDWLSFRLFATHLTPGIGQPSTISQARLLLNSFQFIHWFNSPIVSHWFN